ncbi:helix-turn-helix protein [Clostridium tepidiprofundi DSM 19306]|uniref:Helix-turn-helix protein n=1 Tax=Clostridium tepidiprofundi DSM 19306 TaxID=1121338 RepID=A0A151B7V5_9CLOT|nr:helix-turn-helix protein [Clostridium tepidiprofundi DSM 19306]
MDSDCKFDIVKKKFLHIICNKNSPGIKLKNLRVKNNVTLSQLAKYTGISSKTLQRIENDKVKKPYYYWKKICDYFGINHIDYLELLTLPEKTIQEKLIKIRALLGARTWKEVAEYLGYSKEFVSDLLTRYTPNKKHLYIINNTLNNLKNNALKNGGKF